MNIYRLKEGRTYAVRNSFGDIIDHAPFITGILRTLGIKLDIQKADEDSWKVWSYYPNQSYVNDNRQFVVQLGTCFGNTEEAIYNYIEHDSTELVKVLKNNSMQLLIIKDFGAF